MANPILNGASLFAPQNGNANIPLNITQAILQGKMTQPNPNISYMDMRGLQFPRDLPKHYITLQLQQFKMSGLGIGKTSLGGGSNIYLPMPKQMLDQHSVQFEQKEIGVAAGNIASGLSGAIQSGSMENVYQAAGGAAAALGLNALSDFVKGMTGIQNADLAVQAAAGIAPNQFLTVMLKGPQYKKHELSWTLSPKNRAESDAIREIIYVLNDSMAPGFSAGFFTHPMVVTPKYTNDNVLYKFKPCVIENMAVNYSPSGAPSFYSKTAAPDSVEIRLSLLEIEFWLKGQFTTSSIL